MVKTQVETQLQVRMKEFMDEVMIDIQNLLPRMVLTEVERLETSKENDRKTIFKRNSPNFDSISPSKASYQELKGMYNSLKR